MNRLSKVWGLIIFAVLLAPSQSVGAELTEAEKAESAKIAATVPIADLHDHYGHTISKGKETGVVWHGLSMRGPNSWRGNVLSRKEKIGGKYIAWLGLKEFDKTFKRGGKAEMLNPDNPTLLYLYEDSKQDLKDGLIVGFGEIFINNRNSSNPKQGRKVQADAPIFRKFFDLVAKYDGFLAFHMQADGDSMEQLGKLLASNRKGRMLWNHCGTDSSASDVRSMLDKHPNLFCEFSRRYPPIGKTDSNHIFDSGGIESSWRKLMEDHSNRFMVGTDADRIEDYVDGIKTVRQGLLPYLKPATVRKIAYQNAQRLFGLKDIP